MKLQSEILKVLRVYVTGQQINETHKYGVTLISEEAPYPNIDSKTMTVLRLTAEFSSTRIVHNEVPETMIKEDVAREMVYYLYRDVIGELREIGFDLKRAGLECTKAADRVRELVAELEGESLGGNST